MLERLDIECTASSPWCEPSQASGCSTDTGVASQPNPRYHSSDAMIVPRSLDQATTLRRCSAGSTCPVGLDGEFSQASRTRSGPSASVASAASGRARPRGTEAAGWPGSVLDLLRRQGGDQRVVFVDLAGLGGAAGRAEVVEELDVRLVVVLPLIGYVVFVEDRFHRADRLAGAAVHALVGVDI